MHKLRLGNWLIYTEENRIVNQSGESFKIRPKIFEVLLYLSNKGTSIVTRDELIEHVWKGNSLVGERGVTDAIWQLRKTLQIINTHRTLKPPQNLVIV